MFFNSNNAFSKSPKGIFSCHQTQERLKLRVESAYTNIQISDHEAHEEGNTRKNISDKGRRPLSFHIPKPSTYHRLSS